MLGLPPLGSCPKFVAPFSKTFISSFTATAPAHYDSITNDSLSQIMSDTTTVVYIAKNVSKHKNKTGIDQEFNMNTFI